MTTAQHGVDPTALTPPQRVRRAESLGAWTKFALAGSALLWFIEAAAALWIVDLYDHEADLAEFFGSWFENGPGLFVLSWLVTGGLFVWWHWSARKAVRAVGRNDLERSDGATLGWWFVPLANLVMPFKVVSETYKASTSRGLRWQSTETPSRVTAWTATFLTGFLVVQALPDFTDSPTDDSYLVVYSLGAAAMVIAGYLAIRMIDDINSGLKGLLRAERAPATGAKAPSNATTNKPVNQNPAGGATNPQIAEWEGRISTVESLAADGVLARADAEHRAMGLLSQLNQPSAVESLDAARLADFNTRLLALCGGATESIPS